MLHAWQYVMNNAGRDRAGVGIDPSALAERPVDHPKLLSCRDGRAGACT